MWTIFLDPSACVSALSLSKSNFIFNVFKQNQFFIPRGFAHGFLVLSETATFFYKCDNFYNKESEGVIIYNDGSLNIDWQFPTTDMLISEKDQNLPTLENAKKAW